MNLSLESKQKLEEIYQFYLHNEKVLKMQEIPAHRGSNVYLHTFKLVKKVMKKAVKSSRNLDLEALLVATIFHDYYLYNWRELKDRPQCHAKYHPGVAAKNAKRDFNISDKAVDMMVAHMWPFNFKNPPKGREAWLLNKADTWVAFVECLTTKSYKKKKADKYLSYISTLF